jgi:hypothetical protein
VIFFVLTWAKINFSLLKAAARNIQVAKSQKISKASIG